MTRFLFVLLAVLPGAVAAQIDRPNFLFCIADDWGWPHAGIYADDVVQTPAFDRIASEGVVFDHAYVSSPSCTPSRNAVLTGQQFWRLGAGANLHSTLDRAHPVYPLMLEESGYHIGYWRKSWGPGKLAAGGYAQGEHPVGTNYPKGFGDFLEARRDESPFCFWLGASDPHRPYALGSGKAAGIDPERVRVPAFYPDVEQIRSDIADYYFEVQRFDSDVADAIALLEASGELENTIVVVTGDHGMPFPRCKSNLYDWGARVPLAIRVGSRVRIDGRAFSDPGRRVDDFVSLIDLAPTFLSAAGVDVPEVMTGRSLLPLILPIPGRRDARDHVVFGMERHTDGRAGFVGYPCRGIRTARFAYIRNFKPDRWPGGDPEAYSDVDPARSWGKNITKTYLLENRGAAQGERFYQLSFGKRPAEELYDMVADPYQVNNLATDPEYAAFKTELAATLDRELRDAKDPRVLGKGEAFDEYPYLSGSRYAPDFKPE